MCSYCATELPAGALFCGECGRPVSARRATSPVPRVEPTATIEELVPPATREPVAVTADWDDLGDWTQPEDRGIPIIPVAAPEEELAAEVVGEEPLAETPDEDVWPFGEPEPEPEPAPEPAPVVTSTADALGLESRGAGWCAQCGALMSASDIFCGECGFVRSPTARPRDTVALDPFPWGVAPTAAPALDVPPAVPAPAPSVHAHELPDPEDDVDGDTRIVSPGARGERFILQFSTGESVTVTGAGLLGRNPMPEPGEYYDALVTISDPGKSVSKTHLEFGQEGGSFWVSDRYSGNGTIIREPDRPGRRCDAGKRYRIVRGTRVDIGEQFFVVS